MGLMPIPKMFHNANDLIACHDFLRTDDIEGRDFHPSERWPMRYAHFRTRSCLIANFYVCSSLFHVR